MLCKGNDYLMNNNVVKSAIDKYLFESRDPFALQLDGPWGTGKTYFIQHTIYSDIERHNGIPVYISLNGVHSHEELRNKVGHALLYSRLGSSHKKNNFRILSMDLLYFLGSNQNLLEDLLGEKIPLTRDSSPKLNITNIINRFANYFSNKKVILIFDDLERACFSKIQILMGELLDVIKKFQCKVIIISNENTPILRSNYFRNIKEKIISKTVSFGYDSVNTAMNIIKDSINSDILSKSWILKSSNSLLRCLKNINLRTILSIVYDYNVLVCNVKKISCPSRLKIQGLKTGFLSLFTLTDAVKRNKITNSSRLSRIFNNDYFQIMFMLDMNNKSKQQINGYYLLSTFLEKSSYIVKKNILYTKEIYTLICSERFNPDSYLKIINNVFHLNKNPIYTKLLNKYEFMSDKELKSTEIKFKSYLNFNNMNLNYLFDVYFLITRLKSDGLLLTNFNLDSIKNHISIRISNISPNKLMKSTFLMNFVLPKIKELENSKFKRHLNNMLDHKKQNIPRARDKQALICMSKGKVFSLNNVNLFNHNSMFNLIMSDRKFINEIRSNPEFIIALRSYLCTYIIRIGNSYNFHSIELDYIDNFQRFIRDLIKSCNSRVLNHDYRSLLNFVKASKKVLQNQKRNRN